MLVAFNASLDSQLVSAAVPTEAQQLLDDQRIRLAAAEVPRGLTPDLTASLEQAITMSFLRAFRLVMFIAAGLALGSAFTAGLMITGKSEEK